MSSWNPWESFFEDDEDYVPMQDDLDFDEELAEEIRKKIEKNKYKYKKFERRDFFKVTPEEFIQNLDRFIQIQDLIEEMKKKVKGNDSFDWYKEFIEAIEKKKSKYRLEVDDLSLLEAAQEVATEGPNGTSYEEWLDEFNKREDGGHSEIEFLKLLDAMGHYKDKLELIDNPQDLLDL
jgi:hypothetical protein|tara:strand:- start:5773 stop:6306 length:534 start_codon:yes stop_codon:yes gene_type:complete